VIGAVESAPTAEPTNSIGSGTVVTTCDVYNTQDYTYLSCAFTVPLGSYITIYNAPGACSGDQYIELVDYFGNVVDYNDDKCSDDTDPACLCSEIVNHYVDPELTYYSSEVGQFELYQGNHIKSFC